MLSEEKYRDREWGVVGEFAAGVPKPAPPAPVPFRIPAPDWDEEERDRLRR